jgi:hypothetical protein
LLDTVSNRVLRFALDLKDDLGDVDDNIDALPRDKIDRQIVYNIYGGTNIVAESAQNFAQFGSITVKDGDAASLEAAMKTLGIPAPAISELHAALAEDEQAASAPSLGQRTKAWLAGMGAKLVEAGGPLPSTQLRRKLPSISFNTSASHSRANLS